MNDAKIRRFLTLAGHKPQQGFDAGDSKKRELGAQLLLSEVLEYVIKGLGVTPVINGQPIEDPNGLEYRSEGKPTDELEMIDGLADVAYTMYWNSVSFGIPLEEAFELVCDNNLEKFVKLPNWQGPEGPLENQDLPTDVDWPPEVESIEVIRIREEHYAVGKDRSGKVRKPSTYSSVDLSNLCNGS